MIVQKIATYVMKVTQTSKDNTVLYKTSYTKAARIKNTKHPPENKTEREGGRRERERVYTISHT